MDLEVTGPIAAANSTATSSVHAPNDVDINVLLVDDLPEKLLALEAVLAGPSMRLVKADSGKEALRHLLREDFALILLDVHMPLLDGFETALLIRQRKRSEHTPIIFITANSADEGVLARGYSLGAVDYIFAPLNPEILRAKVSVFVELYRTNRKVKMQADAMRVSNTNLERANRQLAQKTTELQQEIEVRKATEDALVASRKALRESNESLEEKVSQRTADLETVNASLHNEIRDRQAAQESLQSSLREKEVLLKEVHHRVKNNLQIISSLLNLQSSRVGDAKVIEILRDSQNRIRTMALVHEKLYASNKFGMVGFGGYIRDLAGQLFRTFAAESRGIEFAVDIGDIQISINLAIPCGLIVNELISNALKHAFPPDHIAALSASGERPRVSIRCERCAEEHCTLTVRDNGVGMPETEINGTSRSLGLKLVQSLAKQLDGGLETENNGGSEFRIRFPLNEEKETKHG